MIQAYTNDETILARDKYYFKCHQPLPVPNDQFDVDDFFARWDRMTQSAFEGLPSFIQSSFEVRALNKVLSNAQFKASARKSAEYHCGVRQGLLAMMESDLIKKMPMTARQEFFAFMQYAISPYSHLYSGCDALMVRNGNLMDMLLIGHHQFDLIIFDRGLVDSHAISFAINMGLPVVVTTDEVPFSNECQTVALDQTPACTGCLEDVLPHEIRLAVSPAHASSVEGVVYG